MPEQPAEGLTVVLPVFDAAKTLMQSVSGLVSVLNNLQRPYELLIVDDGSTDGTRANAELLATHNARIKVLTHSERKGFGACIRTALEAASQPLFFYTSTDAGWTPSDLPRMLKSLAVQDEYTKKFVEIVNGHRRGTMLPAGRKRLNWVYRVIIRIVFGYLPDPPRGWLGAAESRFWWKCRLMFGLRLGDINSKFKLFRRSVFNRMVLQSNGEFIHAEILAKANFLGCLMDEIILADRQSPPTQPDVRTEMWKVFHDPKFRSPVPTPGKGKAATLPAESPPEANGSPETVSAPG